MAKRSAPRPPSVRASENNHATVFGESGESVFDYISPAEFERRALAGITRPATVSSASA